MADQSFQLISDEEYLRLKKERENWPLKKLIRQTNCMEECGGTHIACRCECCTGREGKGLYEKGEKFRRFFYWYGRIGIIGRICMKLKFRKTMGFLRDDGCALPRRWRPISCLRFICSRKERQWLSTLRQ